MNRHVCNTHPRTRTKKSKYRAKTRRTRAPKKACFHEMKLYKRSSFAFLLLALLFLFCELGFCIDNENGDPVIKMSLLGGVRDSEGVQNSVVIEGLARFAVEEHNKKENALLEFARVVKAKEQVVAGTMHYLTLEAIDAGKKKIYEAKVWVKPWENFKQLQEFKHAGDCPTFTSSDLGVQQGS